MQKEYWFDPDTKEFKGEHEAHPNPLEGGFLLSAHATFVAPNVQPHENEALVFEEDAWVIASDFRGKKQVNVNTQAISVVKDLGVLNDGCFVITDKQEAQILDGRKAVAQDNALIIEEHSLEVIKARKLREINNAYEMYAQAIQGDTPPSEILTWSIQQAEARAWHADASNAATPFCDRLASARGMDWTLLMQKILAKALAFEAQMADITGKRQGYEDAIEMATTKEEVEAVAWAENE